MARKIDDELFEIVKATAEVYGKTVSMQAAAMFLADLVRFTPAQIKAALQKCRQELRNFPSPAEVIARVADGRPGLEEAWSLIPRSEADSVVWTNEVSEAYGVVRQQVEAGEIISARQLFKEVYQRIVAENRACGIAPKVEVSFGFDVGGRKAAIQKAIDKGLLTQKEALVMLPDLDMKPLAPGSRGMKALGEIMKQLEQKKGE